MKALAIVFSWRDKILLSALLKTHLHVSHFPPARSLLLSLPHPPSSSLICHVNDPPIWGPRYPDSSQRILAGRVWVRVWGSRAVSSLIFFFFFGSDLPVTSCKTIARVPTDTTHPDPHSHPWQEENNQLAANTVRGRGKERATLSHFPPDSSENTGGGAAIRGSEKNTNGHRLPHPWDQPFKKKKKDEKWRYWSVRTARATTADVCRILASEKTHKLSRGWRGEPGAPQLRAGSKSMNVPTQWWQIRLLESLGVINHCMCPAESGEHAARPVGRFWTPQMTSCPNSYWSLLAVVNTKGCPSHSGWFFTSAALISNSQRWPLL